MALRIADHWFEIRRVDDDITHIWEPYVDPLLRCNIWHVRGADDDMVIDSGLGIAGLRDAAKDVFGKSIVAVATHTHYDHIGGLHEFERRVVHKREADEASEPHGFASLFADELDDDLVVRSIRGAGYDVPEMLLSALPHDGYDMRAHTKGP